MVFTKETAKKLGRKGGIRSKQRKLTPDRVAKELGPLETVEDARRWLYQIGLWICSGTLTGSMASAANRSVDVWLKAMEADHTKELIALRNRIKELEKQLHGKKGAY